MDILATMSGPLISRHIDGQNLNAQDQLQLRNTTMVSQSLKTLSTSSMREIINLDLNQMNILALVSPVGFSRATFIFHIMDPRLTSGSAYTLTKSSSKQLEEIKDKIQKLELQRQKENELWERKVKSVETELENLYQSTLASKLVTLSANKSFILNPNEAQVIVDFLTKVSFSMALSCGVTEMCHYPGPHERDRP